MKKTLLLLFALAAMGLTNVWAYDFSAVAPSGQTLYYNIVDGNAQVTSQNSSYPYYSTYPTGALVIPSSVAYNGTTYSVTTIGDSAFLYCTSLTSVTIPNSVTTIGNYAFWCCGLTSVTIPNSVTSIGESAFYNCSGLTSVTIPNSVTSIGESAFYNCSGFTSMTVETGNAHYDSRNNCNAIIETSTSRLIAGCRNTVIPNSVTAIGYGAFLGCSGLTSVTIPNSVTSIGEYAFEGCRGLTSVTIGNSVTSIGYAAFSGCSSLTSVTIGNSVTSIGYRAFQGCSVLTSVTIPNSVTSIGEYAFEGCCGLTSVTIPNSVTAIGTHAFWGCRGLTSVTIGNSVTSIGNSAFWGCSGLTSVTIPNSVISIGNWAFYGCSGLTSIYSLSVNPPTIEDETFEDVNKQIPLYVPAESVYRYTNAFGWSDFTNIIGISTQGIEEAEQAMAISVQGSSITVANAQNQMLAIYDIAGRVIVREQAVEGKPYRMPRAGVYMVQVGSSPARKVVVMR